MRLRTLPLPHAAPGGASESAVERTKVHTAGSGTGECTFQQRTGGGSISVPEARECCHKCAGSTSMVRRRRCRHGLAMLHISAQLHRQQLRPAVRHTAEHSHHARYSCRCRWCHCVRPCSWPWSTSVRKSFALLHVQLHHARDRSSRSAGAVSRVVPYHG